MISPNEEGLPKRVDQDSPSFLEKLGAGTDALLGDFFQWWGTGETGGNMNFSQSMGVQNISHSLDTWNS